MTDITVNRGSAGELRIGAALSDAFSVLGRALGSFLLLSVVPFVPALYILWSGLRRSQEQIFWILGGMFLWQILLSFLIQAVIIYGAFQELRGQRFSLGEAFAKTLPRLLPAIGSALAATLIVALGMIALIIPGFIALCVFYVAIPACVVERAGPIASLGRSARLTKGYRGRIFGLLLIVVILSAAASYLVKLILGNIGGQTVGALAELAVQIGGTAFGSVLVAIVYYRLRASKEGIDIDKIASVFD